MKNFLCPGCKAPGLITEKYYCRRKTFGYKDANDNRFADAAVTIPYFKKIQDGIAAYSNYDKLNYESAMYGDQMEDHLVARFQPGDATSGYTYTSEMTNRTALLRAIQILRTIPHSKATEMDLKITGFDFYVDNVGSGVPADCIDCNLFESIDENRTTIFKMHTDDGAQAAKFITKAGDDFLFTADIDDIKTGATNVYSWLVDSIFYHSTIDLNEYLENQ